MFPFHRLPIKFNACSPTVRPLHHQIVLVQPNRAADAHADRHPRYEFTVRPDFESPVSAAEAADALCRELVNESSDLNVAIAATSAGEPIVESRYPPVCQID